MNKKKELLIETLLLLGIVVFYTLIVKYIDVSSIGPNGSEVGLSSINGLFHDIFPYNGIWYKITKYLGVVPFLIVAYYGINGLLQLIKRKSLLKVDKRLISLGCFYLLVGFVYVFFEKVIINYRPVLLDGILEASYPSSHTMLAICICSSSLLISKYYLKDQKIRKILDIATWALMIILVVGRTLSGVHWLSDIIGGILISILLRTFLLYTITNKEGK